MNYKILVVDDEPANTRMLERLLRDHYDVATAQSGAEGLDVIAVYDFALIISDQRMPGMSGVDFLKRSAELRPHCVRIILTGYTDAGDLVDALNSNVVYKYVTKPWVNADLLQTVKRALSHYETIRAQHRLNLENQRLRDRSNAAEESIMRLCFEMLGADKEPAQRQGKRIRDLSLAIGKALDLDDISLRCLSNAAYLHAFVESYVPAELQRQSAVSDSGGSGYRERGLELLSNLPEPVEVIDAVRHLHERFDGSGTPNGLATVQIPLNSRIISVAKAYDDLVQPEREASALTGELAIAELVAGAGSRFDPHIVKAFCQVLAAEYAPATTADRVASLV
jgi:response regulator RpfG family c-di-GMP phosphodiesterase